MSEAARSRRDEARHEPQPSPRDGAASDPLAELARLVGQDDPFRRVFRPPAAEAPARRDAAGSRPDDGHGVDAWHGADHQAYGEQAEAHVDPAAHGHRPAYDGRDGDYGHHGAAAHGEAYDDGHGHGADDHGLYAAGHEGYAEDHAHGHPDDAYPTDDERYYAAEQNAHRDDAGLADERFEPHHPGPGTLPDAWAAGEGPADLGGAPATAGSGSSARRPVLVLAAVLALTGGGLAASFLLAKAPSGSAGVAARSAGSTPTIMAASGPTKVKVEDPSATAPEDQDAALLNKGGSAPSGPVKIVSSQEQPADLGQLPKSDLAAGARPMPAPPPSPFPEPKKVKTFVVHPDGTMLSGDGSPAAAPDPVPSTPKTSARGGTTPKAPAAEAAAPTPAGATIASLSGDPAPTAPAAPSPAGTARQPAAPGAGGGYGLQLASSPVEADANAAFAKLKKKYPAQLGNLTASVHKAETGDKPVYRVRVGSMGQEEAKALCGQLQGAGGSCFVVHN